MEEATLIYPHQLFAKHPALAPGRPVYLIEEPLFLTEFPTHTQKLLLHRLSMQAFARKLTDDGYTVHYLSVTELPDTAAVFARLAADNIQTVHIVDTTDTWLEQRITTAAATHSFELVRFESPLFLLEKADAVARYSTAKKHLATFYKTLRTDKKILLTNEEKPAGGKWSFDDENRQKIPKDTLLPEDFQHYGNTDTTEAKTWLDGIAVECYGDARVWIPYTHTGARAWLQDFLAERLASFGTYEDAIKTKETRLFHSGLSPLLNIGLLTPHEVIEAVIEYGQKHDIALNNIEGFVRQVIGWREFIRAAYECDGTTMRTTNFWQHTNPLPAGLWDATTGIVPLDDAITKTLAHGYNHHIERLMVLGNFLLLTQTDPDEVYHWFMAMYVDAYDWVMVPNVYGMSQFADGGIFATKPYISGSNYLRKMSDYPKGDWEDTWTALYWHFIATHETFFRSNHRLSMMPNLLEKMDPEKKQQHLTTATTFLRYNRNPTT